MAEATPPRKLNIAGRITHAFIDNKLTLLIMLFALLAGIFALIKTPREENPRIVVPAANIIVAKPGASPKEVEQLIVKPLESILQGINGVEHTYGIAEDSVGIVSVQYYVGQNKENALVKLYDHIMHNLDRMPPGTMQPLVKPVDVDNVPILDVTLSSSKLTDMQLREVAHTVLEHLRRVKDTSFTLLHGGRKRQINVDLDLDRMREYNISLTDINRVLEATNVAFPSGTLVDGDRVSKVTAGGFLRSAADVGNVVVGLHQHQPVFLKDVARVIDGPGEINEVHRIGFGAAYSGKRPDDFETSAVTLALAKRAGTNAVTVANNVLQELNRIKGQLIPKSVKVTITRNNGKRANDAVNTLVDHLTIAVVTVILLLVLFLGWRAAGIVAITIPLILFITLTIGMIAGQSINRITLFAIILSLGLLVDGSIVVVENIFRHYAKHTVDRLRDAVIAVNEIGGPTNLATLAVILAFLPMLWVTGMMGPYMAPIPFNVPVAMVVSLIIAYTVAPWAAYRWLKAKGHEIEAMPIAADDVDDRGVPGPHHHANMMERGYVTFMNRLLHNAKTRRIFFLIIALLMVAVLIMPVFNMVLFKMLPKNNTNTFDITIDMPEGTSLEATDRVARMVGDVVRHNKYVTNYETSVGESSIIDFNGLLRGSGLKKGPNIAAVRVNLISKHERDESSITIVRKLRPAIAALAAKTGANIKLVEDPPGPPVRATILAELYGPDYNKLREIAKELRKNVFDKTPDVVDVDDSVTSSVDEYRIKINREKAALAGIMPAQVAATLNAYLQGHNIGAVHIDTAKEPVPIHFQIPAADRVTPADLDKIFFTSPQGREIPLNDIATIVKTTAPKPIFYKDQRPVVYVTGELGSTSQVYAVLKMWKYLNHHALPDGVKLKQYFLGDPDTLGYSLRWDGEMRLTLDVFRDLGSAFGVAIILIYLVLVAYYRSFMIPLIVMGAIPLTIVGVLPGHAIMHQYFTATSMIGVIALAGIVVRNSLLLIDFILEYRKLGHTLEAAVLEAGRTRLRPIVLTALAIILGTLVMIVDPVFGGLAISLIFGTFASTVLTLLVIPLVYYLYARHEQNKSTSVE